MHPAAGQSSCDADIPSRSGAPGCGSSASTALRTASSGAPAWSEVAVHECRAHGFRDTEPWDASLEERAEDAWRAMGPALEQHAPGGPASGAPFAFLAHGSGVGLMCLVAQRLRGELGLDPSLVFVNDGAPPTEKMLSQEGFSLLQNDAYQFFKISNPEVCEAYDAAKRSKAAEASFTRWAEGFRIMESHRPHKVFHVFPCPIHVFIGMEWWEADAAFRKPGGTSASEQAAHLKRASMTGSATESTATWDLEAFSLWSQWTLSHCEVHKLNTNHFE
eukprot:CAMPEP_0175491826 /NCGR_PEP_ID=MMETSP0096-20121207/1957_1 /TAXON_ID=311494 /ORGANISM="Alexandrium monilatum, Strain CCMP3105" /LENGTH=275 /DNA_ID=CAMNT_0016793751 /DNA_START=94 /DNA_END=918 /DNA_ORIENTATION=+